jgi:hypothetical protein
MKDAALIKKTCQRNGIDEVSDNNKETWRCNKWEGRTINDVDGSSDTEMRSTK